MRHSLSHSRSFTNAAGGFYRAMSYVESALRDAKVEARDARGLMPITQAREILGGARVVDRDSLDRVWAAMVSLATPEELVAATRHLEWQMPVRGRENVALVERYGTGALGWIASRVHAGVLINHPWCVVPSLLALGDPGVLEVLLGVRGAVVDGGSMRFWQYTPADVEGDAAALEHNALELVVEWARRHPEVAHAALTARAEHPRAAAALGVIAQRSELSSERILATLDAACRAEAGSWPWFNMGVDGRCEYFGLRLIAVRSRSGNGWGIVLERLMGCDPDSLQIARYAYGPGTTNDSDFDHIHSLEEALQIVPPEDEEEDEERPVFSGMIARGPAGDVVLDESLFARHDLRPGMVTEAGGWMARTLAIRAYIETHPQAFWPPVEEALPAAGVPDGEILLVSTAFEHASGHRADGPVERWHILPSESATYRSLAEAIVARDPARFVPGVSNLDWRLHATETEDGYTLPWRSHRVDTDDGYLAAAMAEAGVTPDERGLMPLAEARAIAAPATSLARGDGRYVGETWAWDLDRTWAALLSLADAPEAAAMMRRLELVDPPRDAGENRALVERYGDAALALVAARADAEGVIQATSPILRTTVLAAGTPAGFAFVWDIKGWNETVATDDDDDGDGDGDAAAPSPDAQATALFTAWMTAHPEVGFIELARLARAGDAAAASYLQTWAAPQVRRVHRWLAAAFGDAEARAILARVGHACDLAPVHLLAALDAAAAAGGDTWPQIQTHAGPSRELHAMRLIGARARGSDRWVIVIERFEGYTFHNCRVDRYVYDEHGTSGLRADLRITIIPQELPQLPIADDADRLLVEAPDYWTKIDNAPAAIAGIRAVLRAEPGRFFSPPEALLAQLGITDAAVVIATTQFGHTPGDPPPSTLPSYRSLADALVAGDPSRFTPGTPNASYAPHAKSVEAHEAEAATEADADEDADEDAEDADEDAEEDEDDDE